MHHFETGTPIQVTNCFSISNYHISGDKLETQAVTELRKREDRSVEQALKGIARFAYLDLPDAPLRGNVNLSSSPFDVNDFRILSLVADYLSKRKNLIVPLALGNHIDHRICCYAALMSDTSNLYGFYEDLPYAGRLKEEDILAHINGLEVAFQVRFTPKLFAGLDFLEAKKELCSLYRSQLKPWYIEKILDHFNVLKGERIWVPVKKHSGR